MINELESMWKEAVMAEFKVLYQNLPGVTKENHKNPQSGQPVSRPRYEPQPSQT
jgi:hypothetical protein